MKGDTVSSLAKKYESTIIQVKDWNKLDSSYKLMVGQKLRVK
ncbi:LysM peptidoglycan-binding domain-containing protein [Peribacillus butanolivorans]